MRILAKLLCFGALVHLFNYAIDSHDTLSTFVSKMGVLFLTIALAWHSASYIWSTHLSLRANRVSTEGKCVLITGCDTGFGHATAITLCDAGFTVFAGCLNSNSQNQLKSKTKNPSKMHILKFDVTCDEDTNCVLKHIEGHCDETGETLYALVNNAGISGIGAIEWGEEGHLQTVLDVNLYGSIRTTRHFIPLLVKSPGSRVIALTSYITAAAVPLMSSYGISKVACKAFFGSLSAESELVGGNFNGMKIAIIEPTMFKTPMFGFDALIDGLNKVWNSTSKSVQYYYCSSFFDGIIAFVKIWKFFEVFEFIALNYDLSIVTGNILKALIAESPEKNYRVIGLLGRATLSFAVRYLPQEVIESFYQVAIYFMILFAWKLSMGKKLINAARKPFTSKSVVQ